MKTKYSTIRQKARRIRETSKAKLMVITSLGIGTFMVCCSVFGI